MKIAKDAKLELGIRAGGEFMKRRNDALDYEGTGGLERNRPIRNE